MTLKEEITSTAEGSRMWHQERAIFETTNMICELMKSNHISRKELANRMNMTPYAISMILDGSYDINLRMASDIFLALGYHFHPENSPIPDEEKRSGTAT